MAARVSQQPLDPWAEIQQFQRDNPALAGQFGATCCFIGSMRDFNQGQRVAAMTLEHYPAMTQKYLDKLCLEASQRWQILDVLLIHRCGDLLPSDPIVLVAVWAAHRDQGFDACRYLIDALKTRAPFWKQEDTASGKRWVEPE